MEQPCACFIVIRKGLDSHPLLPGEVAEHAAQTVNKRIRMGDNGPPALKLGFELSDMVGQRFEFLGGWAVSGIPGIEQNTFERIESGIGDDFYENIGNVFERVETMDGYNDEFIVNTIVNTHAGLSCAALVCIHCGREAYIDFTGNLAKVNILI
jgi:hypothetical protein